MKTHALRSFDQTENDGLPSMAEVERRFAALDAGPPPPWLTPEGLAAMADLVEQGVPEANGPETFVPPADED